MADAALRIVIVFSAAILATLILRKPVRAAFGARLTYRIWLLPPLAALACLVPPRVVDTFITPQLDLEPPIFAPVAIAMSADAAPLPAASFDWAQLILPLWLAGTAVMVLWFASSQRRFHRDERVGKAGPAVVGFLRPRIVMPKDFEHRFDPRERDVIITHETIHLRRQDARINALIALVRCLMWFNPLVHLGARCMRIDQEMACDAAVIARRPHSRRLYADALLKAQLAARPLPLGCYWPPGADHPLTERIALLKKSTPGVVRSLAGLVVVGALALGAGVAAWAALPPRERLIEQLEPQAALPALAPTPAPTSDTEEPAPAPTPAQPETPRVDAVIDDRRSEALRRGKLEAEDRSAAPPPGFIPTDDLVPVQPTDSFNKLYDAEDPLLMRARDKSCRPTCRASGRDITFPNGPKFFAQPQAEAPFDAPAQQVTPSPTPPTPNGITLRFQRIEPDWSISADKLTTEPNGGMTYQGNVTLNMGEKTLRADRLFVGPQPADGTPRAMIMVGDRVAQTFDQPPAVQAAPVKAKEQIEADLAVKLGLLPGEKPGPAFASLFDANDPLLLSGKVMKVDAGDPNSFIWLQTPDGRIYRVMIGRVLLLPDYIKDAAFTGKIITVRGYGAKDKTCVDNCLVNGRDITVDGIKYPAATSIGALPPPPTPPPGLPPLPAAPKQ